VQVLQALYFTMNKVLFSLLFLSPLSWSIVDTNQCTDENTILKFREDLEIKKSNIGEEIISFNVFTPLEYKDLPYFMSYLVYSNAKEEVLRAPLLAEIEKDGYRVFFSVKPEYVQNVEFVTIFRKKYEKAAFHVPYCEFRQKI